MRVSDLLTRAERVLTFFWVLISLGNFAGALFLLDSNLKGSGPEQKTAARGTFAAGGFWIASLAGLFVLGFQSQFSSRRLHSRRLAILKGYFVILLPTRLIYTLVWICVLSFLDHNQTQKFISLACLLDILLIGRFFVPLWMQPEPYAFIGLVKPDLALTREKQHGNHPTGFISDAKATTVVEARQRQYGPRLDDTGSGPGAVRAPTNSGFIYANREWCDEQDGNNDGVCTLPHPDESLHERRELQHFGGFLRCACCVDYSCASSSSKHGDDVERGSSNVEFDMRSQERRTFLRKAPVGAVLGSTPSHGDTNNVHNLCSVCEVVSGRILAHLAALERRSKLEKLLHPQRELCSLKHHDNPSALKVSSDSCHLCALIWSSLNDKQQSRLIAEDESLFDSYREGSTNIKSEVQGRRAIRVVVLNDMLIPHFGGFKRPRRWEKSVLGFRDANTEVGSEFANPLYLTGPDYYSDYTGYRDLEERRSGPLLLPVADTTGSDCVIDWIAHTFKARRNKTSWLPTRVLDVRSSLTGRVLLRLSKDLPESERTQYTALSHCWGKVRLPILTQNNIEQRLVEGLDVEELPRTFVEAMEVTLKLGISYIWIDSFCIIQDSGSDWDHEAALMASVYRNAFCTIAAVDATDGNGGLFRPQYPLKSSPCLIGLEGGTPLYALPYAQSDDTTLRNELALSTWNSRGWILQERYLSSAVVYFCASQVYIGLGDQLAIESKESGSTRWSPPRTPLEDIGGSGNLITRHELHSEHDDVHLLPAPAPAPAPLSKNSAVDVDESLESLRRRRANPEPKQSYQLQGQLETDDFWDYRFRKQFEVASINALRTSFVEQRLGTNTATDQNSLWWAALNEYSMRDLTKDYDKLPAVRGLAVHLHDTYLRNRADDQYVMGMWRNQIIAGLLWYVDLGAHRQKPDTYRAPSWSWASVDGAISNDSLSMNEDESTVEFVKFDIRGKKPAPRPWLIDECAEGTTLTLRGSIAPVRWSKATTDSEKRYYVARSLIRHESEELEDPSALQDLFSTVSVVPEVGPLCHALLHPTSGQRLGWFLPDSAEELPSELFCLKTQVRPRDTDDTQAIWAIRGLVLMRIENVNDEDGSYANDRYRRVGYFELDCEFTGTRVGSEYSHTDEIILHGRRSRVRRYAEFPIMNEPILDPRGLFAQRASQEIVLI